MKLKVAPITERWNEGERDWSFVKDSRPGIERWEKETGFRLPDDYREFMLRFNGGRIYPRLFHTPLVLGPAGPYQNTSDVTYIDIINSWETVESLWRGEGIGKGVPPMCIVFGDTPGGVELLLSLEPAEYGKVFSWTHSINPWGSDSNNVITPQAGSFTEFLRGLYDEENKSDYYNWRIPLFDKLARDFDI